MDQHTSANTADPRLLTVEETAKLRKVSPGYVRRRLIFERRIPYVKVGRYVRIEPGALDALIAAGRVESSRGPAIAPVRTLRDIREEQLASWRISESTR